MNDDLLGPFVGQSSDELKAAVEAVEASYNELQTVEYYGEALIIDRTLLQLRNAANPHLYHNFDTHADLEFFVFHIALEERKRIDRQERALHFLRMCVWGALYVALGIGFAYAIRLLCVALGVD